jgi:hypothetical protein
MMSSTSSVSLLTLQLLLASLLLPPARAGAKQGMPGTWNKDNEHK